MSPFVRVAAGVHAALAFVAWCPVGASGIAVQSDNVHTGAHAIRLTVSRTCTPGDAAVPDGELFGDPAQEPCGTLTANDVDVVSGAVRFKAGESLALGEGFSVAAAASWVAEVGAGVLGVATLRDHAGARPAYSVRFFVDADHLALTDDGQQFEHLVGYDSAGNREFVLGVTYDSPSGERRLWSAVYENDGAMLTTRGVCEQPLPAGWHSVEARWRASSGTDGDLAVSLDGGGFESLAACLALGNGVANSGGEVDRVEWGVQNMTDGDLGWMDLDDFESRLGGRIGGI